MSQLEYTIVAHKFLSAIVVHVVQSQLIEISQSVELWNTQAHIATELQSYKVVHELSGATETSLNGLTEYPAERTEIASSLTLEAVIWKLLAVSSEVDGPIEVHKFAEYHCQLVPLYVVPQFCGKRIHAKGILKYNFT